MQHRVRNPVTHSEDVCLTDLDRLVSQGEFHSKGQREEATIHAYPSTRGSLSRNDTHPFRGVYGAPLGAVQRSSRDSLVLPIQPCHDALVSFWPGRRLFASCFP